MVIIHGKSKRKPTGGRYKKGYRKKKLYEMGSVPTLTKLDKKRNQVVRMRGGTHKVRVLSIDHANVFDGKQYKMVKIKTITENPANRNYVRRNIMTRGSVIETEIGKAKITSRPGQDGTVNAILLK